MVQIASGRGSYRSLSFSDDEQQLTFVTDRDDYGPVKPSMAIHHWAVGSESAQEDRRRLLMKRCPKDWWVASARPTRSPRTVAGFSSDTQPRPEDAGKTEEQLKKEKKAKNLEPQAVVDIWHWKDEALQPQQLTGGKPKSETEATVRSTTSRPPKMVQLATLDSAQRARGQPLDGRLRRRRPARRSTRSRRSWESPELQRLVHRGPQNRRGVP